VPQAPLRGTFLVMLTLLAIVERSPGRFFGFCRSSATVRVGRPRFSKRTIPPRFSIPLQLDGDFRMFYEILTGRLAF
jgi:hypothetical protein